MPNKGTLLWNLQPDEAVKDHLMRKQTRVLWGDMPNCPLNKFCTGAQHQVAVVVPPLECNEDCDANKFIFTAIVTTPQPKREQQFSTETIFQYKKPTIGYIHVSAGYDENSRQLSMIGKDFGGIGTVFATDRTVCDTGSFDIIQVRRQFCLLVLGIKSRKIKDQCTWSFLEDLTQFESLSDKSDLIEQDVVEQYMENTEETCDLLRGTDGPIYRDKDDVQQFFSCQDCEDALMANEYGPGQYYDPNTKQCIQVPIDVLAEYVVCTDDSEPPEVIDNNGLSIFPKRCCPKMMDKRSIPNQFNLDGTMNINAAKDKRYILGEACIMNNETGTSVGCKLGLEDGQWGIKYEHDRVQLMYSKLVVDRDEDKSEGALQIDGFVQLTRANQQSKWMKFSEISPNITQISNIDVDGNRYYDTEMKPYDTVGWYGTCDYKANPNLNQNDKNDVGQGGCPPGWVSKEAARSLTTTCEYCDVCTDSEIPQTLDSCDEVELDDCQCLNDDVQVLNENGQELSCNDIGCKREWKVFGETSDGQFCQMLNDKEICQEQDWNTYFKLLKVNENDKFVSLQRGMNRCLMRSAKPIFDPVLMRHVESNRWFKCDLSRLTICIGENDPGPDAPEIVSPFYDSTKPKRLCYKNNGKIKKIEFDDFLKEKDGEAARERDEKNNFIAGNCDIESMKLKWTRGEIDEAEGIEKSKPTQLIDITCRVPPGEGVYMSGYLKRGNQKSLPFKINYRKPEILRIEVIPQANTHQLKQGEHVMLILNETNQTYGIQTYSTNLNIAQMPDWKATGKPSQPIYTIDKVYTDMQKGKSLEDQIELDNEEKSKVWEWKEPTQGNGDRITYYQISNTYTSLVVKPTDIVAPTFSCPEDGVAKDDFKKCLQDRQHKAPTQGSTIKITGKNFGMSKPTVYFTPKNGGCTEHDRHRQNGWRCKTSNDKDDPQALPSSCNKDEKDDTKLEQMKYCKRRNPIRLDEPVFVNGYFQNPIHNVQPAEIDGREDYRPWFVKEFSPGDRRQVVKPTYKAQSCSFFPVSNSTGDEYSEESINTAIKYLKSGIEEQPLDCDPNRLWTCIRCNDNVAILGLNTFEMENKKQIMFDHPSSGAKHYQFLTLPMVEIGKVLITRGGTDMLQLESKLISAAQPCTTETEARDCGEIITMIQAERLPVEIGLLSREYCISLLDELQFNWANKKNDIDYFYTNIMEIGLVQFRPNVQDIQLEIEKLRLISDKTIDDWWNINKYQMMEHWCDKYQNNSATRKHNFDGSNVPVSVAKYSQSILYATIPPGESPDTMQISFETAGQLSKCMNKGAMYNGIFAIWHSGRSAKDCSLNYLPPNLNYIQAEIDISSGKPNANTEGGFKLTLFGYNFGRPEPYGELLYDEPLNGLYAGNNEDPLIVKIKGIACPILSHDHNTIICQMSEGEGRDLEVDVSLYHNDTDSSNPKIHAIRKTWSNSNRNIQKSDFYTEDTRIQYHFDSPVITKLWIEHENYTISIQNGEVTYDGQLFQNENFGLNYKNEVIHLMNAIAKRGPGLPTSGKSLNGNHDLWIHIEGKNFGSSTSRRQITVQSHIYPHPEGVWDGWQIETKDIQRVDYVNDKGEHQHRHLKFKLKPGEGQLKFALQIQEQIVSNLDYRKFELYAQNNEYFDETNTYVGPNLINISYSQARLDSLTADGLGTTGEISEYTFPTSGCGKFIVANIDENGKLKCDYKSIFVLQGENFGKTMPLVLVHDAEQKITEVTVFENCDSSCRNALAYDIKDQLKLDELGIPIKCNNGCTQKDFIVRTHTKLVLEVPPGVGRSMVEVRTRNVNVVTDLNVLQQSVPEIEAASDNINQATKQATKQATNRKLRRLNNRLESRNNVYGRVSNRKSFDYSNPDILDTRFGIDIYSASLSGVIAAIGGERIGERSGEEQDIAWRLYILGENFGESEPLINLPNKNNQYGESDIVPCKSRPSNVLFSDATNWEEFKYCPDRISKCYEGGSYASGSDFQYGICKIPDDNLVNITLIHEYKDGRQPNITEEPCLDAKWHAHTEHPWRYSGRPMLSCLVPPTTVGKKKIKVNVAKIEVTMDITLDARCFEGFYGKIGEYCAKCWNYIQRHPNIPDAIETVYAAECYADYDPKTGTSEPVSHRGFSILPPTNCQNGGCKISPKCCLNINCRYEDMTDAMVASYSKEACETSIENIVQRVEEDGSVKEFDYKGAGGVWIEDLPNSYDTIPKECLGNDEQQQQEQAGDNAEINLKKLLVCQEGTRPGGFCHPTRVKGNITLNDGSLVLMDAARTICPHIMPCEPPESCDEGGVCNHDNGYVGYYKPYYLERDRDSGKQTRICNRLHWTLPEVVTFVEGSDLNKEIGHTCEFNDMFYSKDVDNGRNGGKDSIVDGLMVECELELCTSEFSNQIPGSDKIPYVIDGVYDKYGEYAGKQDETIQGEFFAGIKHLGVVGNKLQTKIDFTQQSCLSGNDYIDETPDQNDDYPETRAKVMFAFNSGIFATQKLKMCQLYFQEARKNSGCTCYAPRCSQCNPGTHFRLDGLCEPCPETPWLIPLMLVCGAIFGTAMMLMMRKLNVNTTIINIGIDYFQVVSLFARSKAQWPNDFKLVLKWFAIFQFDIDLAAPECLPFVEGWITFERKWWVKVSIPFLGGFFVTLAMMYLGLRRGCSRMFDKKMTKAEKRKQRMNELPLTTQVISMINTLIYFLYLGICRAALSIFNCVDTKPITGRKYLAAEPMEECGDPRGVQVRLTLPAIGVLLFYCVGFPAYIALIFYKRKARIIEDQILRAYGRGENPATNLNYDTRKMFGKMYFPYRPTKYWWALVVLCKKFFLVFFGIYFRNYPTFQMALTLFITFIAFSYHVGNNPFLGMLEKAKIVRAEAEETILREIKKLERAQLLVRINGSAYYQLMHSMRIQIDEQEALMAKHAFSPFNYNTVDSLLLLISCIIVLAGIMFDSDYILERMVVPEYEVRGKVITYLVLFLFIFSLIYYGVVFVHEFCAAARVRRTTRQLMWAKLRQNKSKIRGMGSIVLKGHKKYPSKIRGIKKLHGVIGQQFNLATVVPVHPGTHNVKMEKKKKKKEKDDIMNFLLGVTKAKKKFKTGKRKANRNKKGQKHRDSSSSSGSPSSSSESDSSNESSLSESSTCTESSSSSDVSSSSNSDYSDSHVLDILGVPDIQRKKSIQMFNAGLAPPPPKHTLDENEGSSEGSSAGFESSGSEGSEGNEGSATKVIDTSEEEKKSGIISTTELSKPIDKVKTTVPKVEIVKLRLLMKKMIHNEKRLLGVIKMMDLDKSGKLSMIEFEKLAQKILKKQKEIVTSPALMALVWEDVLKHRQDMTQNEVGSYELCKWLEFGTDKKHVGHQHKHKHKHKHKQEKTEQEKKKEKKETDAHSSSSSSSSGSGSGSGSGSEESDSDSDIGSDGKIRM